MVGASLKPIIQVIYHHETFGNPSKTIGHGGVLGRILADGADVGTGAAAFNGRYAALFDGGDLAFGLAVYTVSVAYFSGFVAQTMAWIGTGGGIRRIWFYCVVYAGFAADSCFKGDGVGHV